MSRTRLILRSNERVQEQHDRTFDLAFQAQRILREKREREANQLSPWDADYKHITPCNCVACTPQPRITVSSEKRNLPF